MEKYEVFHLARPDDMHPLRVSIDAASPLDAARRVAASKGLQSGRINVRSEVLDRMFPFIIVDAVVTTVAKARRMEREAAGG